MFELGVISLQTLDCLIIMVDQLADSVGLPAIKYTVLRTMRSFLVKNLTSKRCSVFLELNYPFRRAPTLPLLYFPKNREYPCLMRVTSSARI